MGMLINLIVEINGFTTCMHMSVYVPVCIHIIHTHTHTHTDIHALMLSHFCHVQLFATL